MVMSFVNVTVVTADALELINTTDAALASVASKATERFELSRATRRLKQHRSQLFDTFAHSSVIRQGEVGFDAPWLRVRICSLDAQKAARNWLMPVASTSA
jgi:hypothetical protein